MNALHALTVVLALCPVLSADSLTLAQALSLAEENHPQLQASQALIDVARAGIRTAKAYPNPEAMAQAGGQTIRAPGNISGLVSSYSVAQPLELGSLRPARLAVAQRDVASTELALSGTRLALLSGVRRAFYQVLRRQSEITILNDTLRLVEDLRQRIQVRVEVGEAGRLELIRAESEVAAARSAANSARLQLVTAIETLRIAVGATLDPSITIDGQLDPPAALPPLDQLRQQVIDNHPLIALATAEVRRAEAQLNYEIAQRRPQPSIVGEVDRPPDSPTYRVGVSVPLPFWNRREGPIAAASAQIRQSSALAQNRRLELLAAVEGAYGRYQVATQQLAALEQGLLRGAEAAVRAAETAYQLGERGILEVLDAQRILRTVRLDFLSAQFERQAALIDLDELRNVDIRKGRP